MARVFIGVGSNVDPEQKIKGALKLLRERASLVAISSFYRTEPLRGPGSPYYNGVVEIETPLPPLEIKNTLLRSIEDTLGRVRSADKHGPRTIDLDLILYGDTVFDGDGLKLPSPEILERAFVAVPLAELAGELALPGTALKLADVAGGFDPGTMVELSGFTKELAIFTEERERQ
jgi:dihydroneopterin aldolase/2-amino-4-hydroxy-6-hydroxymethyldihydropteridine diphosphokinase